MPFEGVFMPRKPLKPCAYPYCPNLTRERYCSEHKTLANREYNQQRSVETSQRYGYQWTKIRQLFLAKHPLCERCLLENRLIPATEVHHKLPLSDGGTHSDDNLQALCKSCHSRITVTSTNTQNTHKPHT
jgi:5-methylcytosine-specific restriction protein A